MARQSLPLTLWSVGHGNRSSEEFLRLLEVERTECVVDVRAYPVSRRHPHFSRAALEPALNDAGIGYAWEGAALGGMRRPDTGSPHTALKDGMRGFADHMGSVGFQRAIERVMALAAEQRTAIMCAEKLPSQCHRSLIADALALRSVTVLHLVDGGSPASHCVSVLARVHAGILVYDGAGPQLPLL